MPNTALDFAVHQMLRRVAPESPVYSLGRWVQFIRRLKNPSEVFRKLILQYSIWRNLTTLMNHTKAHSYHVPGPFFSEFDERLSFTQAYGRKRKVNEFRTWLTPWHRGHVWFASPISNSKGKLQSFWRTSNVPPTPKNQHRVFFVRFKIAPHLLNCHYSFDLENRTIRNDHFGDDETAAGNVKLPSVIRSDIRIQRRSPDAWFSRKLLHVPHPFICRPYKALHEYRWYYW